MSRRRQVGQAAEGALKALQCMPAAAGAGAGGDRHSLAAAPASRHRCQAELQRQCQCHSSQPRRQTDRQAGRQAGSASPVRHPALTKVAGRVPAAHRSRNGSTGRCDSVPHLASKHTPRALLRPHTSGEWIRPRPAGRCWHASDGNKPLLTTHSAASRASWGAVRICLTWGRRSQPCWPQ